MGKTFSRLLQRQNKFETFISNELEIMSHKNIDKASISKILIPKKTKEGVGASVLRVIGTSELRNLDPFLMFDHFSGRLPGGFPDHPHRGFETISYILEGSFLHEDSKGNKGELQPGDVQWMTAGRGVLHAEMPGSSEHDSIGFQIWLNLPKEKKMIDPYYQEFKAKQIPLADNGKGTKAKVICGNEFGIKGSVKPNLPVEYVDYTIQSKNGFEKVIPANWNSLIYVITGSLIVNSQKIGKNTAVVFKNEKEEKLIHFEASVDEDVRFLFIGGLPLNEPIVQHGPFVMNTEAEIQQTIWDYENSKNGFEESGAWKSGIRKLSTGFD